MRKVLITGASRGIGKAIAEKFKEEGYILVCPTRQEMDLSDPRSVEVYIANHKDEYFDVIVNNAGVNEINEITQIKDDELTQMMQINLISPIRLLRGFEDFWILYSSFLLSGVRILSPLWKCIQPLCVAVYHVHIKLLWIITKRYL